MSNMEHPVVRNQPPFSRLLGISILSASRELVEAEMVASPQLINRNGGLHGGAIMAFADNMGGTAAFMNISEKQNTLTVESKTNFIRAVPAGDVLRAVTIPLHRGRQTMVWQTTLYLSNGKVAAIVTQTQLILPQADEKHLDFELLPVS